jgi:hypothetical protein
MKVPPYQSPCPCTSIKKDNRNNDEDYSVGVKPRSKVAQLSDDGSSTGNTQKSSDDVPITSLGSLLAQLPWGLAGEGPPAKALVSNLAKLSPEEKEEVVSVLHGTFYNLKQKDNGTIVLDQKNPKIVRQVELPSDAESLDALASQLNELSPKAAEVVVKALNKVSDKRYKSYQITQNPKDGTFSVTYGKSVRDAFYTSAEYREAEQKAKEAQRRWEASVESAPIGDNDGSPEALRVYNEATDRVVQMMEEHNNQTLLI